MKLQRKIFLLAVLIVSIDQVLSQDIDEDYHRKSRKTFQMKAAATADGHVLNEMESSMKFWNEKAQNKLKHILNQQNKLNTNKAKNVIFFLGDGMGISTVAATRMFTGGEENYLSFEKFPYYGLSKTYCVDKQVPDSACTATAYLNGVKTNYRSIGVTANVGSATCKFEKSEHTESIFKWAQDAGKSTGIVTNARITHASPAGAYAHIPHRDWESDFDVQTKSSCANDKSFDDIGIQLVENEESKKFKVVLGGGRRKLLPNNFNDTEGAKGQRTDGRNLIDEWMTDRSRNGKAKYVWNNQDLDDVDFENTDYLLGLFESDHCMYQLDILNNNLENQEPSLTDMTIAAIKMLQKDKENGYFLFVEGGKIDMAHHDNRAHKSLVETAEFARAVDMAKKMTNEKETLIVVTSDHSHSFTYNGYPQRYSHILTNEELNGENTDGLAYTSLSYANGPGYWTLFESDNKTRRDIASIDLRDPMLAFPSMVELDSATHSGEVR